MQPCACIPCGAYLTCGPKYGSIDWLLLDFASLHANRVRVLGATVHTEPGTADRNVLAALHAQGAGFRTHTTGYGSDHFPISVDLDLL